MLVQPLHQPSTRRQRFPLLRLRSTLRFRPTRNLLSTSRRKALRHVIRKSRLSIAAISFVIAMPTAASAQNANAEQLFRDGDRLMTEGKTDQACDAFEGSNRIEPRAGTLIRLGDCRLAREQLASAWSAYTDALARAKDPKKKKLAEKGVAAVEGRLSRLTITVAHPVPGLAILRNGEPVDPAAWNHALPIDGGHYEITIKANGFVTATKTIDVPVEKADVAVELPQLVAEPVAVVAPPPPPARLVRPPASRWTLPREVAIGSAAVSVVSLATGVVFGLQAHSRETDALSACPNPDDCADAHHANDLIASAHSRARLANVMYGVAGVAAVGAVVLWVVGAPHPEEVAVVPSVGADHVGLAYVGSF